MTRYFVGVLALVAAVVGALIVVLAGRACRSAVLWAQVEATAAQFPGVESVRLMPVELFQP